MDFWTDGSRIGKPGNYIIGWSAVNNSKVLVSKSRLGGSNINAEIFAIRDLLISLKQYNWRIIDKIQKENDKINIITDSKTSIQIINGYKNYPEEYDVNESENYLAAKEIVKMIEHFNNIGIMVELQHIRGHSDNIGNTFADYVATQESQRLMEEVKR